MADRKAGKLLLSVKHGCSEAAVNDSRGPGWYCCTENCWNPKKVRKCRWCGHKNCSEGEKHGKHTTGGNDRVASEDAD